jgi:Zn ribbon nucleic-acid-binding protein
MAKHTLECLSCGETRRVEGTHPQHLATGECRRCGYVGWASPRDLNEVARRALRDRPLERRRFRLRRAS